MPYLDHAATTPLRKEALAAMTPWMTTEYGNPSSAHAFGRRARVAVERSRAVVATVMGCEPAEVVFTSGGTESNNAAIAGVFAAAGRTSSRVGLVTTAVEHHAVLDPARDRLSNGGPVTFVNPDIRGICGVAEMSGALGPNTALASVIWVNNETGAISPVRQIAQAAHEAGALFHTDAVQAAGQIDLRVDSSGVDLMSISGHKFGGPMGIGALYVRAGTPWMPFILGGAQERGRRAGTENVAAIVGFAEAIRLAEEERSSLHERLARLRRRLVLAIQDGLGESARFNSAGLDEVDSQTSSPHILSVSVTSSDDAALDGEMLLLGLDVDGVYASAGSACTSGALESSHVLRAMGVPNEVASATVRFSLGRDTTNRDVDDASAALVRVTRRLQAAT